MERERVRFDHGHRAPAVVDPVAVVELGSAEVGQEQDIRGDIAHAEERRQRGILDRGTLGADAHGAAVSLGSTSQAMVDLPAAFDTTRHAGDEDRRSYAVSEERRSCVDLVQIQLRQRHVDEPVAFQARADPLRLDIFLEIDPDVLALASLRRAQRVAGPTIRRVPAIGDRSLGSREGGAIGRRLRAQAPSACRWRSDQAADVRRIHGRSRQQVGTLRHEAAVPRRAALAGHASRGPDWRRAGSPPSGSGSRVAS